MLKQLLLWGLVYTSTVAAAPHGPERRNVKTKATKLRVETFRNVVPSSNMISSLIIGAEAAVIVDLPLAIPQSRTLASWVRNTTDKPLVAAFITHFHTDHYLSGGAFLDEFPNAAYFANPQTVEHIKNEASEVAQRYSLIYGAENISTIPRVPTPFNSTFFTLPGNKNTPIHILSPLVGDTIDESLFWIPSISTLIAGDAISVPTIHLWLADLLSPALTTAWLSTLTLIAQLAPKRIIPGHALNDDTDLNAPRDLTYTSSYLSFFQREIEAKGLDFYTPTQIYELLDKEFPGIVVQGGTSQFVLNSTASEFGKGGSRYPHKLDSTQFGDMRALEGWNLGA